MKALVIIDSFSFGGAENLLGVMAGAIAGQDLEMSVRSLSPESAGRTQMAPTLRGAGLDVDFLDVSRLADVTALPRLVRAIRSSRCDVVHAHLGYSAILAPPAARLAGVPCVATLHHVPGDVTPRDAFKERLMVSIAGRLGLLVFVSTASRDAFAERYRPRSSWRVVHNGIDVDAFSTGHEPLPAELGIPSAAPVVTVVAALREPKGHAVAVRAWPHVLSAVPDAYLLVVGDGPERTRIETLARSEGVADRVVFAGARSDVARLLRGSTLAALPSYTEALPTALVEASACGLATVATSVGGIPEVIEQGVSGLLVPPRDVSAFGAAVVHLLRDPELRARFGSAARVRAELHFDRRRWVARLLDLYREAGVSSGSGA